MKSWKIGAISGLIAGLVAGLVNGFIGMPFAFKLGFPYWWLSPPPDTPLMKIVTIEIILGMIVGIIMGVIYSKVYNVIPGKGTSKGFAYGLFGYLILHLYWATYFMIYWEPISASLWMIQGLFIIIPYTIVLVTLYEFLRSEYYIPKKEIKIIQYDIMSGLYPGAIAGFLGGVSSFFTIYTFEYTGTKPYPLYFIDILMDVNFLISQLGGQIMWHMIWGIFLGLIFPKVFNLVPGNGIVKGLYYGLVANFVLNEIRPAIFCLLIKNFIFVLHVIGAGCSNAIVYGLVLGYLYRKPSK